MKRNYPWLLSFAVLSLVGLLLIPKLSVQLVPSPQGQNITVSYEWGGASPLVLESQVTAVLEGAFSAVQGVQKVSSVSGYGQGYVSLQLDKNADADALRLEIAALVRQLYKRLPEAVSYPQVALNTPDAQTRNKALLTLQLDGPVEATRLLGYAEQKLKPSLAQVQGVYEVEVSGGSREEWLVSYDSEALRNVQISENQVIDAVRQHFRQQAIGSITEPNGQRFLVRLQPGLNSIAGGAEELKRIPVAHIGGRVVRLGDLASVHLQAQPASHFYRVNGQNALNLTIVAAAGANQLRLAQQLQARVKQLKDQLPSGYQLRIEYDASIYIQENLQRIGIQSGMAVVVLLLFVLLTTRSWRYVWWVGISMLVCLLVSVICFYVFEVEIHLYSLAALTTCLGIIIDNVIVMIEHYRRYRDWKVFAALLGATLTTCAGLSVIWFLPDEARHDLLDFAVVMIITLAVSLVVAVGFIPALLAFTSKKLTIYSAYTDSQIQTEWTENNRGGMVIYRYILFFFVKFRKTVLLVAVLLFGTPVFLLPNRLDTSYWFSGYYNQVFGNEWFNDEFRPVLNKWLGGTLRLFVNYVYEGAYFGKNERTALYVLAELPNNSTIEQMNEVMTRMEREMKSYTEIDRFITQIYNGQQGSMVIYFKKPFEMGVFPYLLKNRSISLSTEMSGISWDIYGVGQGFSQSLEDSQTPTFNVQMMGYNYDQLEQQALRLKALLEVHPRVQEVNINRGMGMFSNKSLYEYAFQTTAEDLTMRRTTLWEVYQRLRERSVSPNADIYTFLEGGYKPIKIVPVQAQSFDVFQLRHTPFLVDSTLIKLEGLARVAKEKVIPEIYKEHQQYVRMVSFEYFGSGHFGAKFLDKTLDEFRPSLAGGYSVKKTEYNWFSDEARKQYELIGLVMLLIYIICAVIFESLWQPLALIGMIPLSYIGVFLGFYWFGFNFDQGGYASFVLLAGNVVCAGIFIIAEWNTLKIKHPKTSQIETYLMAFRHKIGPIWLTVASTVVGLVPFLMYENEPFWFALGVGTIGGLLMSLLVLLFFLPCFLLTKHSFPT